MGLHISSLTLSRERRLILVTVKYTKKVLPLHAYIIVYTPVTTSYYICILLPSPAELEDALGEGGLSAGFGRGALLLLPYPLQPLGV
jgi:hypothetical protein